MSLLVCRQPLSHRELFATEIQSVGTHALVTLAGELDISTVGQLYEQLADLMAEGVRHVSLNMRKVSFVDSTGLSVLVSEHRRSESMDGELLILSPSIELRRLFQLNGLDSYFNIRPLEAS